MSIMMKRLFLLFLIGRLVTSHRIFPAARVEKYTADNNVDLIVNRRQFDILHAPITPDVDTFLQAAKERYLEVLFPEYSHVEPEHVASTNRSITLQRLLLNVTSNTTELRHGIDESYSLHIRRKTATLNAATVYGILHGLETFSQLIEKEGSVFVIKQTPLVIMDAPEYPYRGLMIDTARHYLPLSLIMQNLNAMAMNKLNVLHWHVTDSQSFPYLSKHYPEIADKGGAFSPSLIYTPNDIALVIAHAKLRGIRVIPEFDMPGHTRAIGVSHPEFMSHCPGPSEPFDPTSPAVYDFVRRFYQEISQLFPDEMIHVGGDEVSLDCWKNSTSIQSWMKQHGMHNETQLFDYFETKLLDSVVGLGRTKIVWQEVFNLGLTLATKDTIVDVWKGYDTVTIQEATRAGYQVIVSGCWYLDHLGDDWNAFYKCIPRNFTGTPQQKSLVIGGHASMWGERVDSTNFMQRVWPRASAAAERLWNSNQTAAAEETFQTRLAIFRCHMVARGIPASPVLPGMCKHELLKIYNTQKTSFQ
jgi:hexosaminidase